MPSACSNVLKVCQVVRLATGGRRPGKVAADKLAGKIHETWYSPPQKKYDFINPDNMYALLNQAR
jgi:hypothetical protein